MAFSNEDMLSWFCATNPVPEAPEEVDILKVPGHAKMIHQSRLKAQAEAEEAAKAKQRLLSRGRVGYSGASDRLSSVSSDGYDQSGSFDSGEYYQRMAKLQRSLESYEGPTPYNQYENYDRDEFEDDDEDIGPGKSFNPNANPGDDDYFVEAKVDLYGRYPFDINTNPPLPIENHRENIVRTIERNSVTVIQGETGSGKSTQVAQYILDHYQTRKEHCNIVCTQPRRIAATSIAKFVANRRGWELGALVGYQIGMDKMVSEDTRLSFVTTGVLLEKMINMKNMNQFTHIILDEVHERDKDTDFCLLVVRKLLRSNSKHVKIILMSATFEASIFASYFARRLQGIVEEVPVVIVEGRMFNVNEFFLDDIKHIGTCQPVDVENPRIYKDALKLACTLIRYFDEIDTQDPRYGKGDFVRGTVLVFLPGMPEIKEMEDSLSSHCHDLNLSKIALHSSTSSDNQYRVFLKPEVGRRKVILATNIAESSITVPDIKYVIDFCLVKQLMCDWETKYVCLRTVWASQASLTQRKGRAGRVSHGRCYRLITRDFHKKHVPEYSIPEMLRCPLESVILKVKKLNLGEPRAILSLALQPPKLADIERAILNLKEVGAITVLHKGIVNPYDGEMTFVGQILETLPIDVRLGKLLILGHVFGCLESCLVIAAALSVKSIFINKPSEELAAFRSRKSWAESSASDCIAFLNAYKEWLHIKGTGRFRSSRDSEQFWCKHNFIHRNAVNEVADLVKELTIRLSRVNIKPLRTLLPRGSERSNHDLLILKLVLCGAFYPHYFRWGASDEEANIKAMSGQDPTTTVMVSAIPANGEKYAEQICQLFNDCGKGKALHFEGMKVFLEFERPRPSGSQSVHNVEPVLEAVNVALKKRHSRKKLFLIVNDDRADRYQSNSQDVSRSDSWKFPDPPAMGVRCAPNGDSEGILKMKQLTLPDTGFQQIIITEYVDAGHFWAQFADRDTTFKLQALHDSICHRHLVPLAIHPQKMVGMYCLALYYEDQVYYRARIEAVREKIHRAQVVFVDYGNMEWVKFEDLCELSSSDMLMEMQAFECFLTFVKPSFSHSSEGNWSHEAILRFKDLTFGKYLVVDVYSEVKCTLRVEVYDTTGSSDVLINEVLVQEGYAVRCEEPYQSRLRHVQAKEAKTLEAKGKQERSVDGRERRTVTKYKSTMRTVDWISDKKSRHRSLLPGRDVLREGQSKVFLRGPDNLYEVTFYSLTSVGGFRPAKVERDSVNSIVVENEPQDKHERLMIAAHVALNPAGNVCLARHTTLLPNIHGLIHLVAILFAPTVEMRTDELKRQYTGVLCGLGFDPVTGESIYPEHDVEVTFDTLISQEDLKMINNIRIAINLAIGSEDAITEWGEPTLRRIQARARELIKDLILKPRESTVPCQSSKRGWNQVLHTDILQVDIQQDDVDDSSPPLFPLHSGINISGERIDKQRSTRVLLLRKKMKELHNKASRSIDLEKFFCELCNARCASGYELKCHLETKMHQVSEKELFEDDLDLDKTSEQLGRVKLA